MKEATMADYDVVVKRTDAYRVIAITEELEVVAEVGAAHARLWPRLHAALDELGAEFTAPSIAIERGTGPIEFTAAVPVPSGMAVDLNGVQVIELPGLARAATTVIHGDPDFDAGFRALRAWIEQTGERESGELREIYLDCDGPRSTWVVELDLALEPHS
jgi:hypothetical protein